MYSVIAFDDGQFAVKIGRRKANGEITYMKSTLTNDRKQAEYRAKVLNMDYQLQRIRHEMGSLDAEDAKALAKLGNEILMEYDIHPGNMEPSGDPHGFLS